MYKHVPTFVGKTLTNQWIRLLEGNSLHWLQQDRTLHRASPNLLFPTSLCGVLVFDSVSRHLLLIRRLLRRRLFHTHIHLSHTSLSHTIFHTHLCQPPSFTHNFVNHQLCHTHLCHTHHLSHTSFSTTICHTHLCHTPSFTHNFVTYHLSQIFLNHHLCHTHTNTIFHRSFSTTIFHTQLCRIPSITHTSVALGAPPSFTHNFVTYHLSHTSVALGDIHLRFAWQAWRLGHCAGSGGALGGGFSRQ